MAKEIIAPIQVSLRYEGDVDVVYHQGSQQATIVQYDYYADRMAIWGKNPGFLKDERFIEAYKAGYDTDHVFKSSDLRWRTHVYLWAARLGANLEGDFVECGVNSGIFSSAICRYLDFNSLDKDFYLLDTYQGIPEEQMTPVEKKGMPLWHNQHSYNKDIYEQVKATFAPYKRTRVIKGKVPDTLDQIESSKIAYLSIDMGIVYPEISTIERLWDRLSIGAAVVINHYAFATYNDLQKAYDDFAAKRKLKVLNLPTGQGLLIKIASFFSPYIDIFESAAFMV